MNKIQSIVKSTQYTVRSIQYTMHSVQYSVHRIYRLLYPKRITLTGLKKQRIVYCVLNILFFNVPSYAQLDSLQHLQEVTVSASPIPHLTQTATPVQSFNSAVLQQMNVLQLSDAVKHFSGVTVKDYGGIGGLKTVSIRGLGATHTMMSYDGVPVSDAQNGQIDLGRFTLTNIEDITLVNGDGETLQNARTLASAGIVAVQTSIPKLDSLPYFKGTASFTVGSFGLLRPSLLIQQNFSKKLKISYTADYQYANGEYPYTVQNGDTVEQHRRTNSDVHQFHGEANLFFTPSKQTQWMWKAYSYHNNRGLPGAVILYNPTASQGQRLKESDLFIQSNFTTKLTSSTQLKASGKADYNHTQYIDPYFLNIDNRYSQQEYYLSAAIAQQLGHSFQLSAATDGLLNRLTSNMSKFPFPTRLTSYSYLSGRYKSKIITAEATVVSMLTKERVELGQAAPNRQKLSPMIACSINPLTDNSLLFRMFYKENYRLPTFNELYYKDIGNISLKPEIAQQWDAGVSYLLKSSEKYISATADIYYNRVKDKIMAVPSKNLFVWSMLNLGLVDIRGLTIVWRSGWKLGSNVYLTVDGSYTFQQSVDVSDPASSSYRQLIAYSPENTGSASVTCRLPWMDVSYNLIAASDCYDLGHSSVIHGYTDNSVALSHSWQCGNSTLQAKAEILNIFNAQYAIVNFYPMPGRSWRITINYNL